MKSVYSLKFLVGSLRKTAKLFSVFGHEVSLKTTNYQLPTNRGFSLIEMLVSMALFIVVLTIGIGALLVLINANLKAQNISDAVSNVQFALDSMAREIRTGAAYYCATSAPAAPRGGYSDVANCNSGSGGTFLSVIEGGKSLTGMDDPAGRRVEYRFWNGAIERRIRNSAWVRLTSDKVSIDTLRFSVSGVVPKSSGNVLQPNVTIFIEGNVAGIGDTSATFRMQTTVTQRPIDL